MGWKRLRVIVTLVVLVLLAVLMSQYGRMNQVATATAQPYADDEILVRISSKGVIVTDPNGKEDFQTIDVDPEDPIGSLAKNLQRTQGKVTLLRGGTAVWVSFETSPACTCRCMGAKCKCRPQGCVQ